MSAAAKDTDAQQGLVRELVKEASAFELKWIAKVLLRELRASATEELVLSAYHPDASELFKVDARLREVVDKCCDPSKRLGEASIQVNNPFRPMLAAKMQDFSKIAKNFKNKPFWIEPKVSCGPAPPVLAACPVRPVTCVPPFLAATSHAPWSMALSTVHHHSVC